MTNQLDDSVMPFRAAFCLQVAELPHVSVVMLMMPWFFRGDTGCADAALCANSTAAITEAMIATALFLQLCMILLFL